MNGFENFSEIFLQPGKYHFGGPDTRIRTLLGSCIAITMWHPKLRIGGMCHYMLPSRPVRLADELDGRFADEALKLFHGSIREAGTRPREYQVKLFGGGNMFDPSISRNEGCWNVAIRNVLAARELLRQYGHHVLAEHVGMYGHRYVMLDNWTGKVWVRHMALSHNRVNDLEEDKCINS